MTKRVTLLAIALLAALPAEVYACPVCFDSSAKNRLAFAATAIALTVLPLGMVSGAILWIRKKVRARDEETGEAGWSEHLG